MSRHHCQIVRALVKKLRTSSVTELWWNHIASPEVSSRADRAPVSGQGLGLTMW